MFHQLKKKSGFTIVEVIVAALVFAIAAAGVFATVSSLSEPAEESIEEVTAAYIGKEVLEQWRTRVDATDWDTGPLAVQPWTNLAPIVVDGVSYTPSYMVEADPNGTSARKVTLNVIWN